MDLRATMGIVFGAGILTGFVIGQLVAAIKEKDEDDIFDQPNSEGKTWGECVEEAKMKSEKIPEGNFESKPFVDEDTFEKVYSPPAAKELKKIVDEYVGDLNQGVSDSVEQAVMNAESGLQYAYTIGMDEWEEDRGENWTRKTYYWDKTRGVWYDAMGDEADYNDIHLELGSAICHRLCNHTRLYTTQMFRRDDLRMDIRVIVTDEERLTENLSEDVEE